MAHEAGSELFGDGRAKITTHPESVLNKSSVEDYNVVGAGNETRAEENSAFGQADQISADANGPNRAGPRIAQGPGRGTYPEESSRNYRRRDLDDSENGLAPPGAKGVYSPSEEFQRSLSQAGATPLSFYELGLDGAHAFHQAISDAKAVHPGGAAVSAYLPDEYRNMRLFLTADGKAGFALNDGDVVSVFNHPGSGYSRATRSVLGLAVEQGGNRLDAFDTGLPDLYSRSGFRAVARLPWNEEYAPEGWDKSLFSRYNGGKPDVVFMVHDPSYGKPYAPGDGVRVSSYDEGVAAQHRALGGR